MEDDPQVEVRPRPCIKCRKPFFPADRTRDWYCTKCRREVNREGGLREVSVFVEVDIPMSD